MSGLVALTRYCSAPVRLRPCTCGVGTVSPSCMWNFTSALRYLHRTCAAVSLDSHPKCYRTASRVFLQPVAMTMSSTYTARCIVPCGIT
ncbi:hypothetical protein AeRB84_006239 [Aphanomyces euteiches]|nr:hypothetical protein AeRB84_006239 [Aphanomyces euteiches]